MSETKTVANETRVFIGVPYYGADVSAALFPALEHRGKTTVTSIAMQSFSILPRNFNRLFCEALNSRESLGTTHFCLLHADIAPEPGWLDTLVRVSQKVEADVLSAVVPLKHSSGLTSTAVDVPGEKFKMHRYTMRELAKKKEKTFTHPAILVNTALMLIDITKPWVEKIWFDFDEIIEKQDGKFVANGVSEDWLFSRRARELGASLWATQEVKLTHWGMTGYPNTGEWGSQEFDGPKGIT